jgi:hypothetical protein
MAEQTTGNGTPNDLEHEQAVLLAKRRARRQLDVIAGHCPGHKITIEIYPAAKTVTWRRLSPRQPGPTC